MPIQKLKSFLDERRIKYVTIFHSRAYTAQEVAQRAHISGIEIAKTVIVKMGGEMAMAVLPASHIIDFQRLRVAAEVEEVSLATEQDFIARFPDCLPGAMPPFGNLYGMKVYMAVALRNDEEIAFAAGTHTELVKLALRDFMGLVEPSLFAFSRAIESKHRRH